MNIYIYIHYGCRIVFVFFASGFVFLLSFPVPFALYLQQFGTGTCHFAWYLLHFGMVTLHFYMVFATFGNVCLPFCMVFVTFWHFNLSFACYLLHFGASNVHVGLFATFRVSSKVSVKVSFSCFSECCLRFLWDVI